MPSLTSDIVALDYLIELNQAYPFALEILKLLPFIRIYLPLPPAIDLSPFA